MGVGPAVKEKREGGGGGEGVLVGMYGYTAVVNTAHILIVAG